MFKLFKKNTKKIDDKITMKIGWNQVTLGEFEQIDQIRKADIPDEMKLMNILSILTGRSVEFLRSLPLTTINKLGNYIDFLSEDVPTKSVEKKYKLNGRDYVLECDLSNLITAKYIDYTNFLKEEPRDLAKLISLWVVPKGHTYNDGYDIELVWRDVEDLKMVDYQAITNFMLRQLAAFTLVSADCSIPEIMENLTPEKKQEIVDKIGDPQTHLHNMAFYLWSLGSVK